MEYRGGVGQKDKEELPKRVREELNSSIIFCLFVVFIFVVREAKWYLREVLNCSVGNSKNSIFFKFCV